MVSISERKGEWEPEVGCVQCKKKIGKDLRLHRKRSREARWEASECSPCVVPAFLSDTRRRHKKRNTSNLNCPPFNWSLFDTYIVCHTIRLYPLHWKKPMHLLIWHHGSIRRVTLQIQKSELPLIKLPPLKQHLIRANPFFDWFLNNLVIMANI